MSGWKVQSNYGYGWEDTTYSNTKEEAQRDLRDYQDNQPMYSHRIRRDKD